MVGVIEPVLLVSVLIVFDVVKRWVDFVVGLDERSVGMRAGSLDRAHLYFSVRLKLHACILAVSFFCFASKTAFHSLLSFISLNTESTSVRAKIAGHANDLISLGVDGFRLDAAKRELSVLYYPQLAKPHLIALSQTSILPRSPLS